MRRRYQLCQCWPRLPVAQVRAEVCLDPVSVPPTSLYLAPQTPFSSASHIAKHILRRFSQLHSFPSRYFLGFLSNTLTFQNT